MKEKMVTVNDGRGRRVIKKYGFQMLNIVFALLVMGKRLTASILLKISSIVSYYLTFNIGISYGSLAGCQSKRSQGNAIIG